MIDLIARWDLDKTYLRSDFYTLRDLFRSALERPDQKRPVPGASRMLRELSRPSTRIHVVSGSPEQMRRRIQQRLALDGVRIDELTLKPNLQNLARLRFSALKDQLGYKLSSLLEVKAREIRILETRSVPEVLFGDDSEADAFVYSLYADVCTKKIELSELDQILSEGETFSDLHARAMKAAQVVVESEQCGPLSILIHLDRQSPPSRFAAFGPRLVPFFNYAQAAFVLLDRGLIEPAALYGVCQELLEQHRFDLDAIARSYWDLHRRRHVGGAVLELLESSRSQAPAELAPLLDLVSAESEAGGRAFTPPLVAPLDYLALARQHRGGRDRR